MLRNSIQLHTYNSQALFFNDTNIIVSKILYRSEADDATTVLKLH